MEMKGSFHMDNCGFDVMRLRELFVMDGDRIAHAKKRQAAVWRHERPDKWPATIGGTLSSEQEKIPDPNYREAFYDSDLMLCGQMRGACSVANSDSDAVPSIRANMGTATILSCLGLEQEVFEDKMPWLARHLTKDEISRLEPDDIKIQGAFELGMRHMRRFREIMGENIAIYCMDTQGPFDLAHLMIGDEIFYLLYDDPPFVHHMMNFCVELGIRTHEWMKELAREPLGRISHGNALYAENMGVRICEDTSAIVGEETIREFIVPYTQKLAAHFGGAWVHYCGRSDHLTQAICEIPEIRGINFGLMPEGKQDHDWEEDMARMEKYGKIYFGSWPKYRKESGREYLKRMYSGSSKGLMIPDLGFSLGGHEPLGSSREALAYWYSL
jgi:hypothetical protein